MCNIDRTEIQGNSVVPGPDGDAIPKTAKPSEPLRRPSVALLTPYNGGNFGDAVIQDAVIANLRLRLPGVRIAGITLGSENFLKRHGSDAFPLCASDLPFYSMGSPWSAEASVNQGSELGAPKSKSWKGALKGLLRRIPMARRVGKSLQPMLTSASQEIRHAIGGYRFLRTKKLLIVSGGGQLDEEWGGAWGHPYYLFKWVLTAKLARIPIAIASVGAGKTCSSISRLFLNLTLRLANYRSYREMNTRNIASKWYSGAIGDAVVPDLAFSLPLSLLPPPAGIRSLAQGRSIVALSPIAYAKPGQWPTHNQALYERYLNKLQQVVCQLLESGYFVVLVWSSAGDDEKVISDLLASLKDGSNGALKSRIHIPKIRNWKELASVLCDVDFLVASRLHSAILGFLTNTPVVAISFDPKVDWVMQDLGQTDYLLHINNFLPEDVLEALDRLNRNCDNIRGQIAAYHRRVFPLFSLQYDSLVKMVGASGEQ